MRLATLAFALFAAGASAQTAPVPGSCQNGRAQARLDVGDVQAEVFNTGALFYGNQTFNADGYTVPKGRRLLSSVFASSLWLAGKVGSDLRASGAYYGDYVFYPGPLGPDARPVDPADCSPYDRIYTVSRADVAEYGRAGRVTDDLRDWPWRLGAPVLDGDGDPTNYNLAGGDEPALLGDQTAWWLMNDVGAPRGQFSVGGDALGVEVRAEAGAFAFGALRRFEQVTVYRYTVTNRTEARIDSLYAGLFMDIDLGNGLDDYVGTDTTSSLGFAYNGTPLDDQYGIPPAIGAQVLVGPVGLPNGRDDDRDGQTDEAGERLGMASSSQFLSSSPTQEPQTAPEYFNRLRGRWNDGTVFRANGDGYNEPPVFPVVPVMYPGDPVTGQVWSEVNPGPDFVPDTPGDRSFVVGTGPFRLDPGESQTVTFAIPFAQGTTNLDSITRLRALSDALATANAAGLFESRRVTEAPAQAPESDDILLGRPTPNPFSDRAVLRYEAPTGTRLRATLHDVLGRRLAVLADGPTDAPQGELVIDGSALAPGVYRVRVTLASGERIVTLVRGR